MKGIWKWILIGVAAFLAAFLIAWPLFGGWMIHPARSVFVNRMMHRGMMGWGGFGWIGALFGLAVLVLLVVGVAALVRSLVKGPKPPAAPAPAPTKPCASCGKPLDLAWVACPFCGKKQK
jgi:hypothetical protein